MDSCLGVEQDLEKAISKFISLKDNTSDILQGVINQIENIKNDVALQSPNEVLSPNQIMAISELASAVKKTVFQMSTDHRELHATVSRVGKSIDRHFVQDYAAVAPKAESFCNETNRPLMERAIAEHLYRQGLDDVGDALVTEAKLSEVERTSTFAALQKCAAALAAGDPGPALEWLESRTEDLAHTSLPFTLYRMQALKLCREQGARASVEYARRVFPQHAVRYERQLQEMAGALAWCVGSSVSPPPQRYTHLLDSKALGMDAADVFIKEACACVGEAAVSALAGAAATGARALPALLDVRAKMPHTHSAAWTADHLPLEVELGEEAAAYHSVFACPILRQQASTHNPPMRLLCGHVISRDALNKLAVGLKLKCPYCPMEQSPSEARQVYFS